MRGRRLTILAAISLTCLAVLLCGYFASVDLLGSWYTPINAQTATRHDRAVGLDRGRWFIAFYYMPLNVGRANLPTDWHVSYRLRFGWPEAGPSLWQFTFEHPPSGEFALAFPIWCLAVPCTIAPILWWRRRRRRTARGFAVEVQAAGRE